MTTKPKLEFDNFNLDEPDVLYGEFVFNGIGYSIRELLTLLTSDQIILLKHRLDKELQRRITD